MLLASFMQKDLNARIMSDFENMGVEDPDGTGPMAHVGATASGSRPVDVQVSFSNNSRAEQEPSKQYQLFLR